MRLRNNPRLLRLDRRIGMAWSRIGGVILALTGIAALFSALAADDFSIAGYWPVLAFAALMLFLARRCFRSRAGMLEILAETPERKQN